MKAFFDTNVLLYAAAGDPERKRLAKACLATGGVVSVQVLNEFISVSLGKMKRDWEEVSEELILFRALDLAIVPLTVELHDRGVAIARRYRFHIYDSMVLAAADMAGCDTVWTEDMTHGQRLGRVTIRDPFRTLEH